MDEATKRELDNAIIWLDTLEPENFTATDAILFEPEAVQLVARFDGNNLEMEKEWELMSEFDKDEIIRKKIIREL